jgi:hypothetical protein
MACGSCGGQKSVSRYNNPSAVQIAQTQANASRSDNAKVYQSATMAAPRAPVTNTTTSKRKTV